MYRVVVTGMGIVSSIGSNCDEVTTALKEEQSGMAYQEEMAALGFKCCVAAPVRGARDDLIPPALRSKLSGTAMYGLLAAIEAVTAAGLVPHSPDMDRCGVIIGSGGGGQGRIPFPPTAESPESDRRPPGREEIHRLMNSTAAAVVAEQMGARGRVQSHSAACATGLYNIGRAYQLVRDGALHKAIAGGAEEESWRRVGVTADNTHGMPTEFNDNPTRACRPFDRDRTGFIISSGAGVMMLERYEDAVRRNAPILCELVGYSAANDGADLFVASGDAMRRVLMQSLQQASGHGVETIDYLNAHAAGTGQGDPVEAGIIGEVLGEAPAVSSTKGNSGHSQGAVGAQEAVFTALMMQHGFIAPTKNLENVAENCQGIQHVMSLRDGQFTTAVTMNNGLGGTNCSLVMKRI